MKTYTEQEVKDLMRSAWWFGHEESRYSPNLNGSCNQDIRRILRDHNDSEEVNDE